MKPLSLVATILQLRTHALRNTLLRRPTEPYVHIYFCSFLGLLLPALCCGQAQTSVVLERLRLENCSLYQNDFDRIMADAPNHPSLQLLQTKLKFIDKATASIIADMEIHRAAFSTQKLATIEGDNQDAPTKPVGAAAILSNYVQNFQDDPIPADLAPTDQAELRSYYAAFVSARIQFIDLYGQTVAAVYHTSTREVIELCLVLPLLTTADAAWSRVDVDKLPSWMKPAQNLLALELFALRVDRLQTAYQIHKANALASDSKDSNANEGYLTYLSVAADQLMQINDFDAAVGCLQGAVGVAQVNGATISATTNLRFRLADALSSTKLFKEASDEIQSALAFPISEHDFARAKLLRLKYLFSAGQNAQVLSEAAVDRRDPRCSVYLPQIIYVSWTAARQDPATTAEAEDARKEFLSQFPNHPLAAYFYFASAMEALASGKYEVATQTLRLIEQKFPDSPVATKANDLEKRLKNASPNSQPSSGN